MSSDSITIDGVGPMPVERPASVAELCAIVRRCADAGTAIYPFGGGTMLDYGMPPARPGIALATANLNQVIDYPARDMTITVQAGITMRKLQDTLAAENQWLPIDVPDPEHATIGGAIACDVSGPRRYGYGTLRDYVIGITVVNDRGEECKAGGRVVKNVAGYDLMKLYTGSLGTLGVITQVTLKVRPQPESGARIELELAPSQLVEAWNLICQSRTQPTAIRFQNVIETPPCKKWEIEVIFEGSREAVVWQRQTLCGALTHFGSVPGEMGNGRGPVPLRPGRDGRLTPFEIRASSSVQSGPELACALLQESDWRVIHGWSGKSSCELVVGEFEENDELATALHGKFRHWSDGSVASFVAGIAPRRWKNDHTIWGRPPADIALQKLVRAKFDPKRIFNPGRFVTDVF